jgi:hypothetical protein
MAFNDPAAKIIKRALPACEIAARRSAVPKMMRLRRRGLACLCRGDPVKKLWLFDPFPF